MVKPVVVISGGASGIGKACAEKYLQQGASVFIVDKQAPSMKEACYIACDLQNRAAIDDAMKQLVEKASRIDVFISSAGIHLSKNLDQTTAQEFDDVFAINLAGTFFLLKTVLPVMMKQNSGSIVLIGSDQSFVGKPNSAIYGATKAAIAQLAKSTALDYAKYNIRANAVCPGTIDTPLYRKAITAYAEKSGVALEQIEAEEAALQPLNKVGSADEVANVVCFVASSQSSFTTGAAIAVDGGYTAR